ILPPIQSSESQRLLRALSSLMSRTQIPCSCLSHT
ncbi:unnamed protein product, partial [Rotaria magnacalcarata]